MDIHDLPMGIFIASEDFKIIEANQVFLDLLSFTHKEINHDYIDDFFFNEEVLKKIKKTLLKDKKSFNDIVPLKNKTGYAVYVNLSAKKLTGKSQNYVFTFQKSVKENFSYIKEKTNISRGYEMKISSRNYPNPVLITTLPEGIYFEINNSFEKVSGYTRDEIIGKSTIDLGFYIDKKDRENLLKRLKKEGSLTNYEIRFKIKSGKILDTLLSAEIIQVDGKYCLLSVIHDITDKKLSENKLLESELKLNSILKAAPIGIGTVKNRIISYVNNNFCMMVEYTEDELIGKKSQFLYPDDSEFEKVGKIKYEKIKQTGIGYIETKFKTKTGKILDILLSSTPVDIKDYSKGVVFTAMDITNKKRTEFLNEIIYNISNASASAPDLPDFIKTIRSELGRKMNTSNFFVAFYDKKTDTLSMPLHIDEKDKFTSLKAKRTLTGHVIKNCKPLFITKNEILELVNSNVIDIVGTISEIWIGIPLIIEEETIGALVIQDYDDPHAYTKEDFEILQFISHQISILINRKRADEKINELQKYLQLQIDAMPIGLIVWDEYLQVKSWNNSAEKIFGFTEEEAIGKHLSELIITEKEQSEVSAIWNKLINEGIPINTTNKNTKKTGEEIICHWSNTPLKNDNGKVFGVLSMAQDVTENYKSEQALKESEEKYKNLITQSPDGIFIIDFEGNIMAANKTVCGGLGVNEKELLGKNISNYLNGERFIEQFKTHTEIILKGEGQNVPLEYDIKTKNGIIESFEILAFPYYENGILTGFQGIARDITNRKSTEKELKLYQENLEVLVKERTAELELQTGKLQESHQALSYLLDDVNQSRKELEESNHEILKLSQAIEQSPATVVITDTEGNIEYVNQNFCKVTGYSVKEVKGKNLRLLNSGKHSIEFFEEIWSTIKAGEVWHGEICNKKKNGQIFWENSTISPLRISKNTITNFIAVKEDITERKLTENKIKEYTAELELFNKLMVDRELKIIEMKEEVNQFCKKMGHAPKYPPVWKNSENENT